MTVKILASAVIIVVLAIVADVILFDKPPNDPDRRILRNWFRGSIGG